MKAKNTGARWEVTVDGKPRTYDCSRELANGSRHAACDLLEQFQPFPTQTVFERHEPGSVAARPRQAVDEAGADRSVGTMLA